MSKLANLLRRRKIHEKNQVKDIERKTNVAAKAPPVAVVHHEASVGMYESMAMEQLGLMDRSVTQENVRKACVGMHKVLLHQSNTMLREQVMTHLPVEIRKVLQGRTSQEAYDFYWSLPDFRVVWEQLGFTEQTLHDFVNAQVKALGR